MAGAEVHRRLTRRYGDAVEPWLAGLPRLLEALRDRWRLQLGDVIPAGSMSVVVRCQLPDGRRAVLKLCPDTSRLAGEAAALRHWSGRHATRVFDADPAIGAVLMEEISPGSTLLAGGRCPTADETAALLTGLHRPDPAPDAFLSLADRITYLFASWEAPRRRDPRLARTVPTALLDRGRRSALLLAETSPAEVLLHGDLTPVNVLDGGPERGLVAIDPAPCLGDPAFDTVDLILWQVPTLPAVTERAHAVAQAAGLDPARILAWCTAFAPMAALDVADLPDPSPDRISLLLDLAGR